MRLIDGDSFIEIVKNLILTLNFNPDSLNRVKFSQPNMSKKELFIASLIEENKKIAMSEKRPLCQDCGTVQIFVKKGVKTTFSHSFDIKTLINEAVKLAYEYDGLRKSVVNDPFERINTRNNAPAFVQIEEIEGTEIEIYAMIKGGGSENVSKLFMLSPSMGRDGVANAVFTTLKEAGGKGCPPYFIGIGIGSVFDEVAFLAKKALLFQENEDFELYNIIKTKIKDLNFGILGFDGVSAVKEIFIKKAPTHIAMMPVAILLNCHSFRTQRIVI